MRLDGVIGQAMSGLTGVTKALGTVSQNVANATTPDYVRESVNLGSRAAGGTGTGVVAGIAGRTVDVALQADVLASGVRVAEAQVRSDALSAVDAASGAPGSGSDLASLLGGLRDAFSTLGTDPSNQTQQRAVVTAAAALAGGINGVAGTVSSTRQGVQDRLGDLVTQANTALAQVGQLSDQIIVGAGRGQSTADLEDKRDTAMRTVAELTGAKMLVQPNGDVLAMSGGTVLPTRAATGPLVLPAATLTPGVDGPALMVSGQVAPLAGGQIGAALQVRDGLLPGIQAGLDDLTGSLATQFAAAGLALFTDAAGVVPAPGTAGGAQLIRVNPAVAATPSMVRDGAGATVAAGDTTLIGAVLGTVLGSGAGTVTDKTAKVVASVAQDTATAATKLTVEQAVQTSLSTKLSAGSGVSMDTELSSMIQLQNSYSANAKVITTIQAMWTDVLDMVR